MDCQSTGSPEVTFAASCIELFLLIFSSFTTVFGSITRLTSALFQVTPIGAIRRVMDSPCLSACRPSLLEPSCARCGIGPLLRLDYWIAPDHNGVATFRIGKICRASCPLYAGSRAPSQLSCKSPLTFTPSRTSQPLSSPSILRRFNQGFTCVQLDSDFSSHRFQLWLPTFFLHLLPA